MVGPDQLLRILARMLDEDEFLSPYGLRTLSRAHLDAAVHGRRLAGNDFTVGYEPAESTTGLFGGNSNWRGPVWFPVNYLHHRGRCAASREFFGDDLLVEYPTGSGRSSTLGEIADDLSRRLVDAVPARRGRPAAGARRRTSCSRRDPDWRDLIPFHEYFHGDTGAGLGASHQTGWTALVVDLIITLHPRSAPPR